MAMDRLRGSAVNERRWDVIAGVATAVLAVVIALVFVFDVAVPDRALWLFEPLSPQADVVLLVAGLVTQLGDPWFLLLVATLLYLLETERSLVRDPGDGAFVLAVTFAAFSFVDLLKNVFAAPRPPGAGTVTVPAWLPPTLGGLFRNVTTGTGYAFPSGHALGTTAVFAALAYTVDVGSARVRWALAGSGAVLVAASRVVLGVHFLVDVAVGAVAGACLFAVAAALGDRHPVRVFALGAVLGVLAVVASLGGASETVWKAGQWLGASLGAGAAWYVARPVGWLSPARTVLAGIPIAILWVAVYVLSPPLVVTVAGTAVAAGLTIAAPTLVGHLR